MPLGGVPQGGRGRETIFPGALLRVVTVRVLPNTAAASHETPFGGISPKAEIPLASIIFNANHLLEQKKIEGEKKKEIMTSVCCTTDDSLVFHGEAGH